MKKLIFALPVMLSLTSCTGEEVNAFTVKVIEKAIDTCDYVPSVTTVANLFNIAEVKIVADAVGIVCGIMTKPGATAAGAKPEYKGVAITGHFVKK